MGSQSSSFNQKIKNKKKQNKTIKQTYLPIFLIMHAYSIILNCCLLPPSLLPPRILHETVIMFLTVHFDKIHLQQNWISQTQWSSLVIWNFLQTISLSVFQHKCQQKIANIPIHQNTTIETYNQNEQDYS